MEELKFVERKGGTLLLFEGRQFYKHKGYKNGDVIWKCSKAKKEKCRGSVTIKGTQIIKSNSHSCNADFGKNSVDEAIAKMKVETRLSDTPVTQIYKKAKSTLQDDGMYLVSKIPDFKSVQTSLNMKRLTKYMKDNWLKNEECIIEWNVYGERHRTNNTVESWNSRLNKEVKKRSPKSLLRLLNILVEKEGEISEASERRRKNVEQDDYIRNCQLQLIHGEISLGHFLEKLR